MNNHKALKEIWKEKFRNDLVVYGRKHGFTDSDLLEIKEIDLIDFLTQAMDEAAHGAAEAADVQEKFIKRRYGIVEEEGQEAEQSWNSAIDQSRAQIKSYFNKDV